MENSYLVLVLMNSRGNNELHIEASFPCELQHREPNVWMKQRHND